MIAALRSGPDNPLTRFVNGMLQPALQFIRSCSKGSLPTSKGHPAATDCCVPLGLGDYLSGAVRVDHLVLLFAHFVPQSMNLPTSRAIAMLQSAHNPTQSIQSFTAPPCCAGQRR